MEQANSVSLAEDEQNGKRRRAFLVLLLLLVLATTCMVGYILGRSASAPLGQATDTVLLGPDETPARTATHLTGQVAYQDGSVAAGLKLELHSDPILTETDAEGVFLLPNVPFGDHRIFVYGPDGSVAAEQPVSVRQSKDEQGVSIVKKSDGSCAITVAVDVRILEIAIRLEDGGLDILPTGCTYADGSGLVTTPTGTASVESGAVVTPKGHVHLPDGTIVIPRNGEGAVAVILPDDTVIYLEEEMSGDGYSVETDGTVVLADGTVIRPGGRIVTPDGAEHSPGEGGVVVSWDGGVTPIGGSGSGEDNASPGSATGGGSVDNIAIGGGIPPFNGSVSENAASSGGGEAPSNGGSSTPGGNGNPSGGNGNQPGGNDVPPGKDEDPSDDGDVPPDDDDPSPSGSLSVYGKNRGGYVRWTQSSTIDLFYNRIGGEREKIAPGSSGYYLFKLQNTLSSKLNATVTLNESSFHLPLVFTLTPVDADGRATGDKVASGSLSADGGLAMKTDIDGNSVVGYRLDWAWPAEGNDALDTQAGSNDDLAYLLSMTIRAEQA